jgi:hypothetical protein
MSLGKLIKSLFAVQTEPPAPPVRRTARQHWVTNPWHAVSIVPNPQACGKARALARVRFLSKDAPLLPLEGCNARTCACRYRHHEDRRRALRRASDFAASGRYWPGQERRGAPGRRNTDDLN